MRVRSRLDEKKIWEENKELKVIGNEELEEASRPPHDHIAWPLFWMNSKKIKIKEAKADEKDRKEQENIKECFWKNTAYSYMVIWCWKYSPK